MKNKLLELKKFNWNLWAALCALALIPAIYQTVRTFLISISAQAEAFDIIGQMEWFDLINETLQAFLIVPLYSMLNQSFKKSKDEFANVVFKTGSCALVMYSIFSAGVLIHGTMLLGTMCANVSDMAITATYLRLETVAFMTGILVSFANVVFVVIGKGKNVYIFLGVRTALSLAADIFLIPSFGVYGVAVSNIAANTLLSAVCILRLYRQGYVRFCRLGISDGALFRTWCRTGFFSGLQQLMDNLIYSIMVCKMVNMVAEQGNYWLANNFIWGWLLIPITALGEVIRSDCKNGLEGLRLFNYNVITIASIAFWAITVPAWMPFLRFAQNLENAGDVFMIVIRLIPFYIAYACSAVIDNIFIGLGKTGYIMVNSLIVNLGYYGIFFLLYRTQAIVFDMNMIILMFGLGMVVHYAVSVVEKKHFIRKAN